jgi:hypothetical protein
MKPIGSMRWKSILLRTSVTVSKSSASLRVSVAGGSRRVKSSEPRGVEKKSGRSSHSRRADGRDGQQKGSVYSSQLEA